MEQEHILMTQINTITILRHKLGILFLDNKLSYHNQEAIKLQNLKLFQQLSLKLFYFQLFNFTSGNTFFSACQTSNFTLARFEYFLANFVEIFCSFLLFQCVHYFWKFSDTGYFNFTAAFLFNLIQNITKRTIKSITIFRAIDVGGWLEAT